MGSKRAALVAALFVAGCTHDGGEREATPRSLTVARGEVTARYVAGDRLGSERLAAPVSTTLIANLAPAAVPDGRGRIAYNAWRGDRPVVRVRDDDGDTVVAEGAYSPAWRQDGALAYVQATRPALRLEAIRGYRGHVVVRPRTEAAAVRWTRVAARYVVAGWAGKHLLAYRITDGWPELLVADAPGSVRVLARDAALVAVGPDGSRAFVSTYGAEPPVVRVLDVATGRELARRQVRRVRWIVEAGSWRRNRIVASTSHGLAVFRADGDAIAVEQLVRLDRRFPTGVFEPQLDDEARRVTARGELESRPRQALATAAVVECELEERRCVVGRSVSSTLGPRLVYDPSRP